MGTFEDLQWEGSQGCLSWTTVWWCLLKVHLCKSFGGDRFSSVAVVMVSQVCDYISSSGCHIKCAHFCGCPHEGEGELLHRRGQRTGSQRHLPQGSSRVVHRRSWPD